MNNKRYAIAALALAAACGASAQSTTVRPVLGMGFTAGGETIATVDYADDDISDAKVRSGGLVAFHGGVEVQFTDLVSAQALIGYHVDRANASNGDVKFDRTPIELLGHFRLNEWFRVGGGARYTPNARISASGYASSTVANVDFKPALGAVIEGEFFPFRSLGIKVRYVSERFKPENYPGAPDLKGSHGGVYLNYYFF